MDPTLKLIEALKKEAVALLAVNDNEKTAIVGLIYLTVANSLVRIAQELSKEDSTNDSNRKC